METLTKLQCAPCLLCSGHAAFVPHFLSFVILWKENTIYERCTWIKLLPMLVLMRSSPFHLSTLPSKAFGRCRGNVQL
jgi:hypothetical protein